MSRVNFNLLLTSAAAASDYLEVETNQRVFIGTSAWGTGGSVAVNFTSLVDGVEGTEAALTTYPDLSFTAEGIGKDWVAPVAGKIRVKNLTTGSAGNAVGEISTDDTRSW